MGTAFEYYHTNQSVFLEGLKDLLRIPSISTLPEHRTDIRRAADFLASELTGMGMQQVQLIEGKEGQNPLVYAEWMGAPGKPTVLLYGHYDVQPADPLEEWKAPPFEPDVRGENIYARGATDDKGQVYLLVKAVEGFLKGSGKLPVNIKFLVEGEEEVGGEHIEAYVKGRPPLISCDAAVICDTEMFAPELPTITTGLRGLVYTEVEARGAEHDLHSGMYGGAAPNPMHALAQIIMGLKGADQKIRIPGFYKRVTRPSKAELAAWKRLPFNEKKFMRGEMGATALVGEKGPSVLERLWSRPTLEVHGIRGGFTGEGAKTVIPARAVVKISLRLVPDQQPAEVVRQCEAAIAQAAPRGVTATFKLLSSAPASMVDPENPFVRKAAEAMQKVFGRETVYVRCGGSIPIVGLFEKSLGAPSVMMGFGLPDDNIHAPNEKMSLENIQRGIESVMAYFDSL